MGFSLSRIFTTAVGICVVDFYNAYRYTLNTPWKQRSFVDYMFRDMLNHGGPTARAEDDGLVPQMLHECITLGKRRRTAKKDTKHHKRGDRYESEHQQNCVWCMHKMGKYVRTAFRCSCHPEAYLCQDGAGKDSCQCFSLHKLHGMPTEPFQCGDSGTISNEDEDA